MYGKVQRNEYLRNGIASLLSAIKDDRCCSQPPLKCGDVSEHLTFMREACIDLGFFLQNKARLQGVINQFNGLMGLINRTKFVFELSGILINNDPPHKISYIKRSMLVNVKCPDLHAYSTISLHRLT